MKILFYGTSNYCLPVLETLNKNFHLICTVTKHGQVVEKFAKSHNIKVFTPKDKNELLALKNEITALQPDLAVVADYGLIIPEEIFDIPRYKTLNIHFSKLPKFRGPAPVQYTILTGEKTAGITIIIMDEEMDTGDIIWQKETELEGKDTSGSLYQKLFNMIALELPNIINRYVNNELKPQKQDHSQATYTKHFTREDGFVPSALLGCALKGIHPSAPKVHNWPLNKIFPQKFLIHNFKFIIEKALRAFSPWPGVWTTVNLPSPKRLKLLKAHLEGEKLVLDLVQLEGKKPVSWKQFLEGYPDFKFS